MARDFTGIVIIGAGLVGVAALYYLATAGSPGVFIGEDARDTPIKAPWPMQIDDPNQANSYNRAAYRDNTLRADELYSPTTNFTNDFLKTYAPTVKQTVIPVQQL